MKLLPAILVAAILAFAVPAAAQAPSPSGGKHRVVIQVSDPDPRIWAQAMNYTENLQNIYGKDKVEVEVVVLGMGIGLLKLDSPQATRVAEARKRGVDVNACQSTMKRQKLSKDDMLPDIGYVPGGLVRIIERQQQGWNYIKG